MNEREDLLRKLQSLQFALVDLALYLDTHPDNAEALKMHRKLTEETEKARSDFEQKYGAIMQSDVQNTDYWDWVATPFPWEW